jgi:hypothetical protein
MPFRIAGLDVHFPPERTPFAAQFALIGKVIAACKAPGNALLEAPTGTGKTLALLSGALAAQQHYRVQQEAVKAVNAALQQVSIRAKEARAVASRAAPSGEDASVLATDDAATRGAIPTRPPMEAVSLLPLFPPPRIYFFSRTHSQLAQVVREYGKLTAYTQAGGAALSGPTREQLRETITQALTGPSGSAVLADLVGLNLPTSVDATAALLAIAELAAPHLLAPPVMTLLASRTRTCVHDDVLRGEANRVVAKNPQRLKKKAGVGSGSSAAGAASNAAAAVSTGRTVDDGCNALLTARLCRCAFASCMLCLSRHFLRLALTMRPSTSPLQIQLRQ